MKRFFALRWLLNLSITRKMYLIILLMTVIIISLFFIGKFGMDTLSGLRAYVGAEGLWAKAQKEAVYRLFVKSLN